MIVGSVEREGNVVNFEFKADAELFLEGINAAYKKNVKHLKIQGFRPGKAPLRIIEQLYGKEVFYDDAINIILPKAYIKAIEDAEFTPVAQPDIDVKDISREDGVVFTAKVVVKPLFTLGEYKGVEVKKIEYTVDIEDVDKEIKNLQIRNGRKVTVDDRAIIDEDIVNIDFEGFVDGEAFEGGSSTDHELSIGSGQFIDGFEEQLIGKNVGEECEVNVKFPDEYHAENLAGKDAVFKVKINSISVMELPDADDEFAVDVSEFDTLEELREDFRLKLEEKAKERAKIELENKLLEIISDNTEIDIPEVMIENEVDEMMHEFENRIRYQGMDIETYMRYSGTTKEELKEDFYDKAYEKIKVGLIIEAIIKEEDFTASDDEIDNEYEKLSEKHSMDVEKIKKFMTRENVTDTIINNKVIDFIVESANIVE